MASIGPLYPGSAPTSTAGNGGGTVAWTNSDLAQTENGSGAMVSLASKQISQYLKCVNFPNTSIPGTSSMDGILLEIRGRQTAGSGGGGLAALLFDSAGGELGSNGHSFGTPPFTGSFSYVSLGGSTDPWFAGRPASDFTGALAGVGVWVNTATGASATIEIDTLRMTYWYTPPSTGGPAQLLLMGVGSILAAASAWLGRISQWAASKLWHAGYWLKGGRWLTCTRGIA